MNKKTLIIQTNFKNILPNTEKDSVLTVINPRSFDKENKFKSLRQLMKNKNLLKNKKKLVLVFLGKLSENQFEFIKEQNIEIDFITEWYNLPNISSKKWNFDEIKVIYYDQVYFDNKMISDVFYKHPTWSKIFNNLLKKNVTQGVKYICGQSILVNPINPTTKLSYILSLIENNKHLLKKFNKNEKNYNNLEEFIDALNIHIINNKNQNILKKEILNQKEYKNWFTEEIVEVFNQIMQNPRINKKNMVNSLKKRIKTCENYNAFLFTLNEINNNIEILYIKNKLKNNENAILKENLVLLNTNNYEEMKEFGTSMWCIYREDFLYREYKEELNELWILWITINNKTEKYGFTRTLDGKIKEVFDEYNKQVDIPILIEHYLPERNRIKTYEQFFENKTTRNERLLNEEVNVGILILEDNKLKPKEKLKLLKKLKNKAYTFLFKADYKFINRKENKSTIGISNSESSILMHKELIHKVEIDMLKKDLKLSEIKKIMELQRIT